MAALLVTSPLVGCGDDDDQPGSADAGNGSRAGSGGASANAGRGGNGGAASAGRGGSAAGSGGRASAAGSGDEDASVEDKPDASTDSGDHLYGYVRDEVFVTVTRERLSDDAPELANGREMAGWTVFMGQQAIVANGAEAQQWKIGEDLKLTAGPVLGFGQYPLSDGEVNFFFTWQADDHHVYTNYDLTSRVVWDPTEMKVLGTYEDSKIALTFEGLRLDAAGNRSGLVSGDQPTQMSYFYRDDDWWKFGSKSVIALYDRETHAESKVVEAPCPGLAVSSRDEEGYTYWSTWDYKGLVAAYDMGPWPCIVRLTPQGDLDEAFTTDLRDLTGGLSHRMFQYVRDGWGVMMVWDHENSGLDFANPKPSDEASKLWWSSKSWSVWKVDLKNKKAAPYEGIEGPVNPEVKVKQLGDKTYFYTSTGQDEEGYYETYKVYELNADDSVTFRGEPKGDWYLVR